MIKDYLKYRINLILLLLILWIIFPLVSFLYAHELISILYALILYSFIVLVYIIIDIYFYQKRWRRLKVIIENKKLELMELPLSCNALESSYQEIITNLYNDMKANLLAMEKDYREQMEYYTMWMHQIKTPIAAMELTIKNSRSSLDNRIIEGELFKIEQYVEMALQYVKIKNLASDLVIREYELIEIIRTSVKKYASLFINKKLSVTIEPSSFYALTDSKWISFIIEQLLSNAIKYTNKGGIAIYADANKLVIEDTGIGIRPEDLERIFEKGYTGYNGRLDKKASGIGLYLSKKVADAISIRIIIKSKLGLGTKAILEFPENPVEIFD
ncbi:sensor histidine kinase [Anaerocolumna sp. AGMB13020]|uniref:sensor histidine kinase n=1 Tax=Anaerocolumna sp. AGMB13020 TaxID=3081750 RepID=UPI002954DA69|nr:sensor histidine kinase [Anaerocolumna sp. AGMB13020]WOO37362.1 sensor histidine kinase [Anaerocolumna sp. AGMB13020]